MFLCTFEGMKSGKTAINLIVIKTDKIQAQFEFYSALGLEFEYHKHGNGPHHYASNTGQPVIEIYPLPKGILLPDNTTRLGFVVEDLDQLIQILKEKGIKIVSDPAKTEWGYSAVVEDLDGRKIELTESKAAI
jgi:catechol 2,3-dioxygenase-like lactoylglutathione lyase family enzyme